MSDRMDGRVIADEVLIGFLDLCGTKAIYKEWPLNEQVNRITKVVSEVWAELSNTFEKEQDSLYVHMFADSLVIAERIKPVSLNKLIRYFLRVQFNLLRHRKPILCRCMVRKGAYYGICLEQENKSINFSLVGGPTIVEIDGELKGLPAGVYIDQPLVPEFEEQKRLVAVEDNRLMFVKPPEDFLSFHSIFNNSEDVDQWVNRLIDDSAKDENFTKKIKPWADAVAGRSIMIRRSS